MANMEVVFEGRDSRSWIRACCFSPNGSTFALASTDNKIYLYDSKSFALKAKVWKGENKEVNSALLGLLREVYKEDLLRIMHFAFQF